MSDNFDPVPPTTPVSRRAMVLSLVLLGGFGALVLFLWLRWPGQKPLEKPPHEVAPSRPGWKIRYNATISLAVLGSDKVQLDLLREMLDEPKQLRNWALPLKNGKLAFDQESAWQTIRTTLKAVIAWHKKLDVVKAYGSDKVKKLYTAIHKLATEGTNPRLRQEALRAEKVLHIG